MKRDYDIFEKFSDGSTIWRAWTTGQFETERKIRELAEHSANDFFAVDIQDGQRAAVDKNAASG
jgi:hypothetical protein